MHKEWMYFYLRTTLIFFIYYLLNSYINYTFCLNIKLISILLVLIIVLSFVWQYKQFNVYIYGMIITLIFMVLIFFKIIQLYILAKNNIGESGFGILEIISLIPMLIINLVFLIYNFYQNRKHHYI